MSNIDADTHIIESPPIWEHIDAKDRHLRPQPLKLDDGIVVPPVQRPSDHVWVIDGQLYARTQVDAIEDFSKREIKAGALSMTDPDARLQAMDTQGVDIHVIFPSLFLACQPDSPAVELAITRAYNRFLADRTSGTKGRIRWVWLPAVRSMEESLKDLEWAKKNGAVGIHLRGLEGDRPIDHPDFFPIYERAQDLDMPICVHIGHASPSFAKLKRNAENGPSRFHMIIPMLLSFTALATGKVAAKFPKLRFGFFEAGSCWLTFLPQLANKVRDGRDRKAFTQSVLADANLYVTCEEHEELPLITAYAGDDHLMIGSDYGHPGDVADSIFVQKKLRERPDVTDEQKRRIFAVNPGKLFNLA